MTVGRVLGLLNLCPRLDLTIDALTTIRLGHSGIARQQILRVRSLMISARLRCFQTC